MSDKEDLINGEIFHVYTLEDNIGKMSVLFKLIYKFNAVSIKNPRMFHGTWQADIKFVWKVKRLGQSTHLKHNNGLETCSIKYQAFLWSYRNNVLPKGARQVSMKNKYSVSVTYGTKLDPFFTLW